MSDRKVRVRFAPSPTGALHIGGVRTALYNYLFARQHGGDLIFRIEDTDSSRFVPGAEEYIIESFKWLGIKFDEGVSFGGEHGPYRQSERRDIYKKYVDVVMPLAEEGTASPLLISTGPKPTPVRMSFSRISAAVGLPTWRMWLPSMPTKPSPTPNSG